MNNTHFLRYVTGSSKVHLMNSKYKTAFVLLCILTIIFVNNYSSASLIGSLLFAMAIFSKVGIKKYLSNILVVWPIYILVFVLTYLVTFNLDCSIVVFLKTILFMLLLLIYTFTTSLSEIAWGFECLFSGLKKLKIPVTKISLRIAFFIKFISTLFEQFKTVRKSMAYRGISYSEPPIKTTSKMFMPVVRLSYKLSVRTIKTMKLRFYGASKKRTNYHENKVTNFDKIIVFVNLVVMYGVLWLGAMK